MTTYEFLDPHHLTEDDVADINRLLPQLTPSPAVVDLTHIIEVAKLSAALVVRDEHGRIQGTATLCSIDALTGHSGFITNVVVDESWRGRGIGEAFVKQLVTLAQFQSMHHLELTSNSARVAANHLYQKLGFRQRPTNHYLMLL